MNPRVCTLLAAFLMSGTWACQTSAQIDSATFDWNSHPASRRYTMNDGLPQTVLHWVIQDRRGFIWIATNDGLTRFDGYSFKTYEHNGAPEKALGHNNASTLWEDAKGRFWISNRRGLELFDPATEQFQLLANDLNNAAKFRVRKDGKLWICADGVYIADPETLSIERMTGLPDGYYWDIAEARDGSLWVVGQSGVVHFDGKTERTSVYRHDPNDPRSLSRDLTLSLFIDEQDRVWIGGWGLNLFDPTKRSFTRFLTTNEVRHIFGLPDGKLLVGHGRGVYLFNPESRQHELIADGWSTSVLKDGQGIIWHTSLQGLNQINPQSRKFRMNFTKGELFGYCVQSMVMDGNNGIWLLDFGRGGWVRRFDPLMKKEFQPLRGGYQAMSVDGEGCVWFISSGKLEKYDFQSETVTAQSLPVRDGERIISTYVDSFGNVWLGQPKSLDRYNPENKTREQLADFPKAPVYCFLEDRHKNLWIGSAAGLVRYGLTSGKLDIFQNDPDDRESLSDNTVFTMTIDNDENIWIGTAGGLNKVIRGTENGNLRFMRWQRGLPHRNVTCIVDGQDGTLWLACGSMVSHFNPRKNSFRNYDHRDGLAYLNGVAFAAPLFGGSPGLRTSDGTIAFGTYCKGVVTFHPDSLVDNPYIPPVVITDFLVGTHRVPLANSEADTLEWKSPLEKDISSTSDVKLSHYQNDFSFQFAALNFVNPEGNKYKYKLEPYETEWIETDAASRVARYTNIDAGTYTFRVIGSNNDGVWNQDGASLHIIITPPWWETWWAYSSYAFAIIGLFLYWRTYDNKRIKLKHRAEHLSELDNLKSRFFANISHEFRTPVTLILGPLKDLYNGKSKEDPKTVLGPVIRNGQRLHRLINQLLDLSKIEARKMKLHAAPTDMVEFLREIAASYESLAADKKISYAFYPEMLESFAYIDAEKMEKVVHNLLSNAFKFTKPGGEIILSLKAEKSHCLITVKDTGIGIPGDQLEKVFDRFYQVDSSQTRGYEGSGLGMALAKELVELHKGKISVQSIEGKGTIFSVMLPLGKEHLSKEEISDTISHSEKELLSDIVVSGENGDHENVGASNGNQPVLLIVEDNPDMRNYIRKTLSDHYQILEAENGKSGAKLAEETIPDLIISDIMMPEMDGYKLCELIKTNELTSHIPFILLTAKADRESKLAGLKFGADDYLSKPFDADELKLIVHNRIEERRKMRERFSREITLEPKQIAISSLDEKFLDKVMAIIEAHMDDEDFSIEELSREAGFSNMHFYRKIKGLSGQTPSQFLRTIRLKRAAELLAKDSDNVTQIAYAVGFSSLSYFNKCFKEQFGMTPGKFSEENAHS